MWGCRPPPPRPACGKIAGAGRRQGTTMASQGRDKTGTGLGRDWDKPGTRLGQDWDKTGTRLGQDQEKVWGKTRTRQVVSPRLMRATMSAEFESLAKQATAGHGHGRFSGDKHGPVTTGRLPWWACPKEKSQPEQMRIGHIPRRQCKLGRKQDRH